MLKLEMVLDKKEWRKVKKKREVKID